MALRGLTKKAKSARYELMATKVGGSSLGGTEVLAEVSLSELQTIGRIAKALARDQTGVLLAAVKTHVDFWEYSERQHAAGDTSLDWLLPQSMATKRTVKQSGRKTAKREDAPVVGRKGRK